MSKFDMSPPTRRAVMGIVGAPLENPNPYAQRPNPAPSVCTDEEKFASHTAIGI